MIAKVKRELIVALWKITPKCTRIKINNKKFRIPLQRDLDHKVMGVNREKWMDEIIKRIYKYKDGIFIDIGAHAGQTLLKVKSIIPYLEYIGFEPNVYCSGYINKIINENNFQNCKIFSIGLGENDEILMLYCHNISDLKGTVVENFHGNQTSLLKQAVIIKHAGKFIERLNIKEIAVVKIDVEGYEASVLSGLRKILQQQRPFVICEVLCIHDPSHPSYAFRVQSRKVCAEVLHDVGYSVWAADERHTVEACGQISDKCTNYVFAPKERENLLKMT